LIRYTIPEQIYAKQEPRSAFGVTPTFRELKLFFDVKSFAAGSDAPVCWYANDKRVIAFSNSQNVGTGITEELGGALGPSVRYGESWQSIQYWDSVKPWVEKRIPSEHHHEIFRNLPALKFSRLIEADAFVNDSSSTLLLRDHGLDEGLPTIVSTNEALALLGLYLRFRQDYTFRVGPTSTVTIGRVGYGALVAELLLPEVQLLGDESWSLQLRLARALYSRDRIHRCYFADPNDHGLADESFFYLDALLVSLVAAFDLAARHSHRQLQLAGTDRDVSWAGRWRNQLQTALPALYDMTKKEHVVGATMTMCSTLRNYVHGSPLVAVDFRDIEENQRTIALQIPSLDRDAVYNAMLCMGGDWKIVLKEKDLLLVDVPTLTERLLGASLRALAAIFATVHPDNALSTVPAAVRHLPPVLQSSVVESARQLIGPVDQ
jgi:hypothetical protein